MVNGENWLKAIAYPVSLQFLSQSLNQTGDPQHLVVEYIHSLLFDYPILFWLPGFITYVSAINSVSSYLGLGSLFSLVASSALCLAAVVFRLSSSFRVNPELLSFAPLWFENLITGVDRNYTLNIFWTGLAACFILVFLQLQFSGRVSKKGKRWQRALIAL
jgi:ethanolamine phosphate transferase 2 subunit G